VFRGPRTANVSKDGRSPPYRVEVPERRRVGIFGGTFDPPHVAHVVLAAAAIHQLDLDELIVTVAGVPWQKVGSREISSAETRLEMAEAAFANVQGVVVSDIELRRTGNSYTVDTLREFTADDADLFLLLGSDTAEGLDTWERPEEIAHLASIAVFPRRGYEHASPPEKFAWTLLELPGLEISSTEIRRRRRDGRPVIGMTPDAVHAIIERDDLYRPAGQV
jgi:nicotinate-nucleotide adenylyltransferase